MALLGTHKAIVLQGLGSRASADVVSAACSSCCAWGPQLTVLPSDWLLVFSEIQPLLLCVPRATSAATCGPLPACCFNLLFPHLGKDPARQCGGQEQSSYKHELRSPAGHLPQGWIYCRPELNFLPSRRLCLESAACATATQIDPVVLYDMLLDNHSRVRCKCGGLPATEPSLHVLVRISRVPLTPDHQPSDPRLQEAQSHEYSQASPSGTNMIHHQKPLAALTFGVQPGPTKIRKSAQQLKSPFINEKESLKSASVLGHQKVSLQPQSPVLAHAPFADRTVPPPAQPESSSRLLTIGTSLPQAHASTAWLPLATPEAACSSCLSFFKPTTNSLVFRNIHLEPPLVGQGPTTEASPASLGAQPLEQVLNHWWMAVGGRLGLGPSMLMIVSAVSHTTVPTGSPSAACRSQDKRG